MNLTPREFVKVCGILASRGQKIPRLTAEKKTAATADSVRAVRIEFPGMRVTNPLNGDKGHWAKPSKHRREIRTRVYETLVYGHLLPALPVRVRIHRIGKQLMDEFDGLPASLKNVLDAVADAYGVKDNDPRLMVEKPTQERGKEYGVVVVITARCEGRKVEVPC